MNETPDSVDEKYLLCFDPDLESFRTICSSWLNQWPQSAPLSGWPSLPHHTDFVDYCCFALRIYSHLMSTQVFTQYGFQSDASAKLNTYDINVPIYILDMIREICRPMYTSIHTELRTYFPLTRQGIGLVPGLGATSTFMGISAWIKRSDIESKAIVEENIGTTPICIVSADKTHFAYSNGCNLPMFRREAITRLKFISVHPRFILGCSVRENHAAQMTVYTIPFYGEHWMSEPIVEETVTSDVTLGGYTREDGCFIYDPSLTSRSYYDVLGARIDSNFLTASEVVNQTDDDHTDANNPIGLGLSQTGSIPIDYLALIMKSYSIPNEVFSNRTEFRTRFNFGTTFVFKIHPTPLIIGKRFPSNENPSKDSMSESATVQVNVNKKIRKSKKQAATSSKDQNEKSDDRT